MLADFVPIPTELLERLTALGVDTDRLLQQAEIPRARFEAPRGYVTTGEFFTLWRAVAQVGAARDLGLRLGSEEPPHRHSVASTAALLAPNLGEALKKLARYKRLVCPEQITIDVVRGEARVRFEWLLAADDPPTLLIDGVFASVVALARKGTGRPIVPRRIELTRRRADEAMLQRHFGCEIHFDAPVDLLVLEEAALAHPFVTHDAELLELLVPGLEAALSEAGGERSLADDVRRVLSQRICGERPAVEKVSKTLGMSARTLQRRLEGLGTTYQQLLDDVRRRSARRLLANTDLDPGEVAFLLGFEEINSFTRAFHGWEGMTPMRWRATSRDRGTRARATG